MTLWLLGGAQVLWFVALVIAAVRRAVRTRVLLTSGLGLLVSLVISTTATPAARGIPLGVMLGTGIAVFLTIATRRGVTFTWNPDTEYWTDNTRLPPTENILLAATALYLATAATTLATT